MTMSASSLARPLFGRKIFKSTFLNGLYPHRLIAELPMKYIGRTQIVDRAAKLMVGIHNKSLCG